MTSLPDIDLGELAQTKLVRVLGPARAEEETSRAMAALGLERLTTIEELTRFAEQLQTREGFVATVGALLAVEAARRRLLAR